MAEKERTQQVEVPSRGLLYNGAMPDGMVQIQSFSTKGEKILSDSKTISEVQNEYLDRYLTLPSGMHHLDLLIGDRTYLFFMIRAMSYGPFYDFEYRCEVCNKKSNASVNIEDLPVKYLDYDATEPFAVSLPECGDTVSFNLFRGHDFIALQQWIKRQEQLEDAGKETNPDMNAKIFELGRILKTVNGQPFPDSKTNRAKDAMTSAQRYVADLSPLDSSYLQQKVDQIDPGLDLETFVNCNKCKSENNVSLVVDRNFFRASTRCTFKNH